MTDSSTTQSRDLLAPSWLIRANNHSPTPPFRAVPTSQQSPRGTGGDNDNWGASGGDRHHSNNHHHLNGVTERKILQSSRFQWQERANGGDLQQENYFNYPHNGHNRISDYDQQDTSLRRSNSINNGGRNHHHHHSLNGRNNGSSLSQQNLWNNNGNNNGRGKFEGHFRNGNGSNGAFREAQPNSNGISYSIVTSKGLRPGAGPTSPVLQQSDFPSLSVNPAKVEVAPTKCAQNTVWGNPPHLAKVMKRSLSNQSYMEGGGTILGPHYGKGFFLGTRGRDLKEDYDVLSSSAGDGLGIDDYKSDFAEHSSTGSAEDDIHPENLTLSQREEQQEGRDSRSEDIEDAGWTISDVTARREQLPEPSMLSSTGSTGSVESMDSHHSNQSGPAMMVEDLLEAADQDFIAPEEKERILHALEEIKERTGSESYYERALKGKQRPIFPDTKDDDEEDPDDDDDPDDSYLK
ncbi:hypothetical protein BV898_01904 [Hypsibius exemplaris]|uniref:Uncharacterized protein n=1 Tax=Hypsibius exemplaris TaxID=2072580 RepID=A0A1W0XAD9_HYPEX|nr:hypothetical protein BV898_01904 [Hypsibius exemplaris]